MTPQAGGAASLGPWNIMLRDEAADKGSAAFCFWGSPDSEGERPGGPEGDGSMRGKSWLLRGLFLTGISGLVFACAPDKAYLPISDCAWTGKAFTWIGVNANGVLDPGEPPLPGLALQVNNDSFG